MAGSFDPIFRLKASPMLWHRLRFLPHLEPKSPCQNTELIIRPLLNFL